MKLKKIIIAILLMIIVINAKTKCFAKFSFEYIKKAVEITITN